jgi:hypothetical protein
MGRLLSPDDKCIQADVPTIGGNRRYSGQSIDVTSPSHERVLRKMGYTAADIGGAPVRSGGRRCADCGFNSFFKTCGRCGGSCERPEESR